MADLTEKLTRALQDLGDSPETVAAYLRGQGITGRRMRAWACPLAKYLSRALGTEVGVSTHAVVSNTRGSVLLPPAVEAFRCEFDRRKYPDLIEREELT